MLKGRSDVQLKIIKKPWFIPIVLTILILIIGNIYTNHLVPKAETLPEDEIRSQLEHMYGGKVERLSLKGSMYEVELSLSNAAYLAEVDAETGKVLSLFQTKEIDAEETPIASVKGNEVTSEAKVVDKPVEKPDEVVSQSKTDPTPKNEIRKDSPATGVKENKPAPPKKEAPTVLISKNEAIKIALTQMNGEVDDVEFVQTSEGGHYLVEIEVDDDNDDERGDEAVYKIHAITGKVLHVSWED